MTGPGRAASGPAASGPAEPCKCPLCGCVFHQGAGACPVCPTSRGCAENQCPNCGYVVAGRSAALEALRSLGRALGRLLARAAPGGGAA